MKFKECYDYVLVCVRACMCECVYHPPDVLLQTHKQPQIAHRQQSVCWAPVTMSHQELQQHCSRKRNHYIHMLISEKRMYDLLDLQASVAGKRPEWLACVKTRREKSGVFWCPGFLSAGEEQQLPSYHQTKHSSERVGAAPCTPS